jgi:hypothetical protein
MILAKGGPETREVDATAGRHQVSNRVGTNQQPSQMSSREQVAIGVLLMITVVSILLPALNIYLMSDDFEWLDAAYEIPQDPLSSFERINNLWRPMVKWTFLFDYLVFGRNPIGYAATNLLIHVLNVWLLYLLLSRLQEYRLLAAAAAAGFALSPLHSEAVFWASSRGDTILLTSWLGALLLLVAWRRDARRVQIWAAGILIVMGAGAKESWVVYPVIVTLFLVAVLDLSLRAAMRRLVWLWLVLVFYVGALIVLPITAGGSTAAYYADLSPIRVLVKVCRLLLSYCGLGGPGLNDVAAVGLAVLAMAIGVAIAIQQRNRPALWAITWIAATLALAASFEDPVLRHNYLPLAGFWMTLSLLVNGALKTNGLRLGRPGQRALYVLIAAAAVALLAVEGVALQREIRDYRRYGRLHRELVTMLKPVEPRIPRDRPLLFINRGRRRAVEEVLVTVTGVKKSFFVRRDAIWQMVFLPPLVNYLGKPFEARLSPVPIYEVSRTLRGDVTVLVFTDRGFRFTRKIPDQLEKTLSISGRIPRAVSLYRFDSS